MQGAIGFGLASYWLLIADKLVEIFKPITKCNNRNHVITLDSHLKTALLTEDNQQPKREGGGLEKCRGLSLVMTM